MILVYIVRVKKWRFIGKNDRYSAQTWLVLVSDAKSEESTASLFMFC